MVRMKKYLLLAGALATIAFSAALALAHDSTGMMERGRTMEGNSREGMMGATGRGGMMGRDMEGCMQMMQGMHGVSQRPNAQWRQP
jgi:hypothetical protein